MVVWESYICMPALEHRPVPNEQVFCTRACFACCSFSDSS